MTNTGPGRAGWAWSLSFAAVALVGCATPQAASPPPAGALDARVAVLDAPEPSSTTTTERPEPGEVRVLRETDGTAFAIFPDGAVLKIHGPRDTGVILGSFVPPGGFPPTAACPDVDPCARPVCDGAAWGSCGSAASDGCVPAASER